MIRRIGEWKKIRKKISCICMIGTLAVSSINAVPVEAAKKTTVSVKKVVIPIGKQKKKSFTVLNKKSGAKYTFKSSNKKIVKVSSKGVLTGVKNGSAKIVVSQKLKKKVTKIGTVKVTVKKACALKKNTQTFTYKREKVSVKLEDFIKYINPDATYKLVSNNSNIAKSVTLKKSNNYAGTINLKKAGTVTFTIQETYKKKTTSVCKFKIVVKKATFNTKAFLQQYETVDQDVEFAPLEFIDYAISEDDFSIESDNSDVLSVIGDKVCSGEAGEAVLTIYNGEETLASVKIKVQYVKITGVNASKTKVDIFLGATAEECISQFTIEPVPSGGKLTNCQVTSLDESVCSVNFDPENSNIVEVIGGEEGSTSIVITNIEGETLKMIPVTVVDAMNARVDAINPSTNELIVNMDEDESSFTFTTQPSYAYANNCTVEVENTDICNASIEEVEGDVTKAVVCVTGYAYGTTKLMILNQEEKVLATIPVKVVDSDYTIPKKVEVSETTVNVYEGDIAEFIYTVKTAGAKADYCAIEVENQDICTVVYLNEEQSGNVQITAESLGTTKFYIKNFDGEILETITVNVIEQPDPSAVIESLSSSTNSFIVNMDEEESSFTFTTLPINAYASNCIVEVENNDICDAVIEEVEGNVTMAKVCVTGHIYGSTNLIIRNQDETILATIPVKVVETGYTTPNDIQVSSTTVNVYSGDSADFTYTVKTEGSKADYCVVEVENQDICTVQCSNEEKTGNLQITAEGIGTTKIYIKSLEGKVLKIITVKVTEEPEETE